jgi:D-3-phosphoglycerate dehydrogenase / 2-oxoglutarate reductase
MSTRVLVTCKQLQHTIHRYRDLFSERGIDIDLPEVDQHMRESELIPLIGRYDGMIAGDDEVTAAVLEAGRERLKVVSKWGVGVDGIDKEAAERLGIRVLNTPNVFGDEVADVAMGYIILLARQLHRLHESVRDGGWLKIPGRSLRGTTLGVVGLGDIGRALVERARAHGMRVVGHDPVSPPATFLTRTGVIPVDLTTLLRESDFISLNCPLTDGTRHVLDRKAFELMRPGVYIVNTGRGALIDEHALVAALQAGHVAGAALDVFEDEPLPLDSPLRRYDNVIFGTHNASNTIEAVLRVNDMAIENLINWLGI